MGGVRLGLGLWVRIARGAVREPWRFASGLARLARGLASPREKGRGDVERPAVPLGATRRRF